MKLIKLILNKYFKYKKIKLYMKNKIFIKLIKYNVI